MRYAVMIFVSLFDEVSFFFLTDFSLSSFVLFIAGSPVLTRAGNVLLVIAAFHARGPAQTTHLSVAAYIRL